MIKKSIKLIELNIPQHFLRNIKKKKNSFIASQ